MSRLAGQHAAITGGGTGIGAAIARALAAEGAKLTLIGRRREKLEEVGREDFDALVAPADVTDREQVEQCFATARAAQGPITILVNNAGAAESGSAEVSHLARSINDMLDRHNPEGTWLFERRMMPSTV